MSEHLSCAETAKLVRLALKKHWPGQRFSVTCTPGSSINVKWTDGPPRADVDKVAGQFEGGRFDAMQDLAYHADHWLTPDGEAVVHKEYHNLDHYEPTPPPTPDARLVSFGANYVFVDRSYSVTVLTRAATAVCERFGIAPLPDVSEDYRGIAQVNDRAGRRIGSDYGRFLDSAIFDYAHTMDCYTPSMGKDARKALKKGDTYRRMDACTTWYCD